jgi:hypothetical protein
MRPDGFGAVWEYSLLQERRARGRRVRNRRRKALDGPDRASRMVLFLLYYLGLAPYENARHFLGLRQRSWVNWTEELCHRCGKELLRRGMFPPRKYFCSIK